MVTIPLYWFDWIWHIKYLDMLYLPSEAMAKTPPWIEKFKQVRYLPPGSKIFTAGPEIRSKSDLRVFYVGGIEPPYYDLAPLFLAVKRSKRRISLTICCREKEWNRVKSYYEPYLNQNITIVHRSGAALEPMYKESDLFAVVRSMGSYIDLSVPIKIYESIGFALPVLCTPGGETERIVREEQIGWVKSEENIAEFLDFLAGRPDLLLKRNNAIRQIQTRHTWEARAAQVCNEMVGTKANA